MKYTASATLALIASLFASILSAQTQMDIAYDKFTLPNGLTVLVHEDHKAPIVAVNVWYHVGSKNEHRGKTGFAHLYEHLMFGGSENAKGSYIQAMEKIGATDLNGTTAWDRTNYFENVPTNALDYALFLESDRMGHFLNSFDKATLELQRGVVQNEKRQGLNEPYGVTDEIIPRSTYPAEHPYSWTVIGSMEDLNAASLEDVKAWFRQYYGPSNTVIVLAGDIDKKTAHEKMTKYFGDIPPGPPIARHQTWIAKMSGTHRETVQDRVPQTRIYKVWNVPGFGTADADYLDLVSDIFAKSKVSRLYQRLVYTDQTATQVSCYMDPREIGGQFAIDVKVRPGQDAKAVENAIDEELAKFLAEGPKPDELKRVQTQYTANFLRNAQRIGGFGGKSDLLAQSQVYTGDPSYLFKTSLQRHQDATPADILTAAKQWLSDGQYVLTVVPFGELTSSAAGADRSKPPAITGTAALKLPKLQRATLSNGMKIILAERHEVPVVNFWLAADVGYAADSLAAPGIASLTSEMLLFGTKNRSALEIDEQIESLGAQLSAHSNVDLSLVMLSALKSKLEPSLELFADVAMNPAFPGSDFARVQKQRLAVIQEEKVTPITMGLRVLPPLLFGQKHAYGVPYTGSGTEESVAKMTAADLARFHSTWYRPNNATLVIVGDTSLDEMLPKLESVFGKWAAAKAPTKNLAPVQQASGARVYLIDRPGSEQSVILTGLIAPPKSSPGGIPAEVANVVLGGNFSGRLNMNLREDKHYTYGAGSVMLQARAQRPFLAYAPVQSDKTKESLVEMAKEFGNFVKNKPITKTELADAQANETLKLPGSRETIEQVGRSILEIIQCNLPDNYFQTFTGKVIALQLNQVDDAAKSLVQPEKMVWVVVGDRAKIEAGIRDLKLGPLELLDADGRPVKSGRSEGAEKE